MRIASSSIFAASVFNIDNLQANMYDLQNQLSTGRRVLTPADDPIAAAQSLDLGQGKSLLKQFDVSINNATSSLGAEENSLKQMVNLLTSIQSSVIQAGSSAMSPTAENAISQQLQASYKQLLSLANGTDQYGKYLFSGFKGDTQPFAEMALGQVNYQGDSGQRMMQVSQTTTVAISDSGADFLVNVPNGNGYFATGGQPTNTGTAMITTGMVSDPQAWANTNNTGDYRIAFHVVPDPTTPTQSMTNYDIINNDPSSVNYNRSMIDGYDYNTQQPVGGRTDTALNPNSFPVKYTDGGQISLSQGAGQGYPLIPGWNFGAKVSISGSPADGDAFTIQSSRNQDVFSVLGDMISATQNTKITPATQAQFQTQIGYTVQYLQNAMKSVLQVQTAVGARMNQLKSIQGTQSDISLQYSKQISTLMDVDYAKGISDFTQNQMTLNAAMKSFSQVQNLTLFQYIN
ncbi:flagellar hook-associated protein FlgL [Burkholderiaceae bacterium DAT-1]|nr:flagellar hook-associated protein FlgL [Burkholderiaceae bacterium DAT-1]